MLGLAASADPPHLNPIPGGAYAARLSLIPQLGDGCKSSLSSWTSPVMALRQSPTAPASRGEEACPAQFCRAAKNS